MSENLAGHIINGAYRIESQLADGGMSIVYLATQLSLSRLVVLKVLRAGFIDEDFVNLFLREARINSQLNHPNVVSVVDFGRTEEGLVFLAMEYLDGITLDDYVTHEAGLPLSQIAWVIEQVCAGIQAAHKLNVVHRDLKPNNVMISRLTGDSTTIKVLDFGISKPLSEEDLKHTKLGMVMGTPGYLAPEQIEGRIDIDQRADIYALGGLLYFMAAGKKPYGGASREIILAKQISEAPPKLDPLEIHDEACVALQPVIDKAMQIDRHQRYTDVTALWQAVAHIAQKQRGQSRTPPPNQPNIAEADAPARYQFVFTGKLVANTPPDVAKAALVKTFKISADSVDKLFLSKRAVVKKDISFTDAEAFKAQFFKAGCLGFVEEMQGATRVIASRNPRSNDTSLPSYIEPIRIDHVAPKQSTSAATHPSDSQHTFGASFQTLKPVTDNVKKKRPALFTILVLVLILAGLTTSVALSPTLRYAVQDAWMAMIQGYEPPRGVTPDEIRIGMSAAFSGSARELGRGMQAGIEAYFRARNDAGGIHGRMLRLIPKDDGYEPMQAQTNIQAFLTGEDAALAMVGNVGTPTAKAIIPVALQEKLLLFGTFSGASLLRNSPPDRYVFNFRASYEKETQSLIHYFVKVLNISPNAIGVFYQNDSFGKDGLTGVIRALQEYGLTLSDIPTATYERNTAMVSDAVTYFSAKNAQIKAIIIIGTYSASADFTVKLKDTGYAGHIANVSFVGSRALAARLHEEHPDYARGVIVSQVVPHYDAFSTVMIAYRDALKKYFPNESPNFVSAEGYLTAKVFTEGLERAGRYFTVESLVDTLSAIENYDAGIGELVSFSAEDHQASHRVWGTRINADGAFEALDLENVTVE